MAGCVTVVTLTSLTKQLTSKPVRSMTRYYDLKQLRVTTVLCISRRLYTAVFVDLPRSCLAVYSTTVDFVHAPLDGGNVSFGVRRARSSGRDVERRAVASYDPWTTDRDRRRSPVDQSSRDHRVRSLSALCDHLVDR